MALTPIPGTNPLSPVTDNIKSSVDQLTTDWGNYLKDPRVQAGLMQFTINMMQPTAPGQTTAGKIGRSVGAGGEAIGRLQKQAAAKTLATNQQDARAAAQKTAQDNVLAREQQIKSNEVINQKNINAKTVLQDQINKVNLASIGVQNKKLALLQKQLIANIKQKEIDGNRKFNQTVAKNVTDTQIQLYKAAAAKAAPGTPQVNPNDYLSADILTKNYNALQQRLNGGFTNFPDGQVMKSAREVKTPAERKTIFNNLSPAQQKRLRNKFTILGM